MKHTEKIFFFNFSSNPQTFCLWSMMYFWIKDGYLLGLKDCYWNICYNADLWVYEVSLYFQLIDQTPATFPKAGQYKLEFIQQTFFGADYLWANQIISFQRA